METVGLNEALENADFQEEHCKLERVTESYLLLKKKMTRSHDLIKQYNDKAKECEKLKADLQKAKEVATKMTANYNQTMTKLVKVELQNTDFKKRIDTCTKLIAEHETKISADQRHIQQLNCKLKEIEDKHSAKLLDHEMEKLQLQEKVKELTSQNKDLKRPRKGGRKSAEKTKAPEEVSSCEVGTNTETVKIATSEKFTMTTNQSIAKATRNMAVNTECHDKVLTDKEIMTEISYKLHDKYVYPLYCEKCEKHLDPTPLSKICEIMSNCPPMLTEVPPSPILQRQSAPRIIVTETDADSDTSKSTIQSMERRLEMLELQMKRKFKKIKKPSAPKPSTPPPSSCCHHNSSFPLELIPNMMWESLLHNKLTQALQKNPPKSPPKTRKRKSSSKNHGRAKRFKANRSYRQKDSGNWSVESDTSAAFEQSFRNSTFCEEAAEEDENISEKYTNFQEDRKLNNEEIEKEIYEEDEDTNYEENEIEEIRSPENSSYDEEKILIGSFSKEKIQISKLEKKRAKISERINYLLSKPEMEIEDSPGKGNDGGISKKGTENIIKMKNNINENVPMNDEFVTDRISSSRSRKSSNSKPEEKLPKPIELEEENKAGINASRDSVEEKGNFNLEQKTQSSELDISLCARKPSIVKIETPKEKIVLGTQSSFTSNFVKNSSEIIRNSEKENLEFPGTDSSELRRSSEESKKDSPKRNNCVSPESNERTIDLIDSSHESEESVFPLEEGTVKEKDENSHTLETDSNETQKPSVRKRRVSKVQIEEDTSKVDAKNSTIAVSTRRNLDVIDLSSGKNHLRFNEKGCEGNMKERKGIEKILEESSKKETEECDLKNISTAEKVQLSEENQEEIRKNKNFKSTEPKPIVIPPKRTVLLKKLKRLRNQSKKLENTGTSVALLNLSSDENEKFEMPMKKHRIAHSVKNQNNSGQEKIQFPTSTGDSWKDFKDPNVASILKDFVQNDCVKEIATTVSPDETFEDSTSPRSTAESKEKKIEELSNSKDDSIDACNILSSSVLENSNKSLNVSEEREEGELSETEESKNDSSGNFDKSDANSSSEKIQDQEKLEICDNTVEKFEKNETEAKNNSIRADLPKKTEIKDAIADSKIPGISMNISEVVLDSPASPANIEDRIPRSLDMVENVSSLSGLLQETYENPASPENRISKYLETPESPEKSETPSKSPSLERRGISESERESTISESPENCNRKNVKDSESELESDLAENSGKSEKSWKSRNSSRNKRFPRNTETSESEKEIELSQAPGNRRVLRRLTRSSESEKETDSVEGPEFSRNSRFRDRDLENLGKGENRLRSKRNPAESQETSLDSPAKNCFESPKPLRRVTRQSECQEGPESPKDSTRSLMNRKTSPRTSKQPETRNTERSRNLTKNLNGFEEFGKLEKKSETLRKRNLSMKESESEREEDEEKEEKEGEEEEPIRELRSRSILDPTRKAVSSSKSKKMIPDKSKDSNNKEKTLPPKISSMSSTLTVNLTSIRTPDIVRHVPVMPVRELRSRKVQLLENLKNENAKTEAKENNKGNLELSQRRMSRSQEFVDPVVEETEDRTVVDSANSVLENLSGRKRGDSVGSVLLSSNSEERNSEESGNGRKRRNSTKKPVKEISIVPEVESESNSLGILSNDKVEIPGKGEEEETESPEKRDENVCEENDILEISVAVDEFEDEDMKSKEGSEQNFEDNGYLESMESEETVKEEIRVDEELEKRKKEKLKEESKTEEGFEEKNILNLIEELEARFVKSDEEKSERASPINERKEATNHPNKNGKNNLQGRKGRKCQKGFEGNQKVVKRKKEVKLDEDGNPIPEILSPLDLLDEYIMSKSRVEEKSVPKTKQKAINEIIEKKDRFVEHQLYILINNKTWESEAHSKVVEMVSKVPHRFLAMSVINFMVKKAGTDRTLDKTYTPPAPLLTAAQQKILAFLTDLEKKAPILDHVLAGIEYKLLRLNASPDVRVVEYLTRIMVAILRIKKDRSKLRIFLCDSLYCLGVKAIPLIYVILTCWPEAFPSCGQSDDLLVKSIVQFVLLQRVEAQDFKASAARRMFTDVYGYPSSGYRPEMLCDELLTAFRAKHDYGLHTAILLLAKREGTDWAHRHIIKGKLLPMIIRNEQSSDYHAFHLLGNIMRSYSVDDSEGIVKEIVDQLCDLLDSGEGSEDRQEGVASALLSLSRHQFKKCLAAVLKWKPTKDLREITRVQLHATFEAKNSYIWKALKWNLSKSEESVS